MKNNDLNQTYPINEKKLYFVWTPSQFLHPLIFVRGLNMDENSESDKSNYSEVCSEEQILEANSFE